MGSRVRMVWEDQFTIYFTQGDDSVDKTPQKQKNLSPTENTFRYICHIKPW